MAQLGRYLRARRAVRLAALLSTFGLVASVTATVAPVLVDSARVQAASVVDVMAWAPYWEVNDALASFNSRPAVFSELTPFFWTARSATEIVNLSTAANAQKFKDAAGGKPVVATITDGMPARAMAAVLADPVSRGQHVGAIVQFVTGNGFSGVDIDYESFAFDDGRDTWTTTTIFDDWGAFLTELSAALHSQGKTLAVAVPPIYNNKQDSTSGYWVYNYPVMAQVVDRVRIMTYSYSGNAVGPIAPYKWVEESIDAALAVPLMAPGKIVMGIAAYGNDVITKIDGSCPKGLALQRRGVTNQSVAQYAADKGVAKPDWDPVRREQTFSYVESYAGPDTLGVTVRCNVYRTVWYSDPRAIYERVLLAQSKGVAGIALWALGYDDAATWDAIAAARANNTGWTAPGPLNPSIKAPAVAAPYPRPIFSAGPLPARYVDTRAGGKTADGLDQGDGRRPADSVLTVQIGSRGPVPGTAAAVTLNVTALGAGNGYVTVYPCGDRPTTSNLNVRSGQIISNTVITKLSAAGTVCIYTQQAADLVVDVFNVLPAAAFNPVETPARLLDTRAGSPTIDGQAAGAGALEPGGVLEVQIAGRGRMSSSARTAVLNVTADGASGPGFLTVWSCDSPRPATSNVNYVASAPIPNAVVTGLSARGTVCVMSLNRTDVVIDTFGELAPDHYQSLVLPSRLLDTRVGGPTVDGSFSGGGRQPAGSAIELQVAGRGGLSASAGAAVLNVTVDGPAANGFVTVYPCGTARPLVSNVNFASGQTLPNLVVTDLSDTGTVCIYNLVPTHIVVDVFGALRL